MYGSKLTLTSSIIIALLLVHPAKSKEVTETLNSTLLPVAREGVKRLTPYIKKCVKNGKQCRKTVVSFGKKVKKGTERALDAVEWCLEHQNICEIFLGDILRDGISNTRKGVRSLIDAPSKDEVSYNKAQILRLLDEDQRFHGILLAISKTQKKNDDELEKVLEYLNKIQADIEHSRKMGDRKINRVVYRYNRLIKRYHKEIAQLKKIRKNTKFTPKMTIGKKVTVYNTDILGMIIPTIKNKVHKKNNWKCKALKGSYCKNF